MSQPARTNDPTWLSALQLALVLSSIALVVAPALRLAAVLHVFYAAAFANCAVWIWREWKTGLLGKTPGQLYERARAGERFPRQTLALCAAVASSIAMWKISLS